MYILIFHMGVREYVKIQTQHNQQISSTYIVISSYADEGFSRFYANSSYALVLSRR